MWRRVRCLYLGARTFTFDRGASKSTTGERLHREQVNTTDTNLRQIPLLQQDQGELTPHHFQFDSQKSAWRIIQ